ncbi:M28 family peptidase [Solimonas sp. C16B3]|uniref:M28 family peptidase n=2 Tax=Solimonas marina TaxID=2714601 RepID=A0A969WAE3_9GAMM|nr:M28 family peptidase [Solimonas marina]
MPLFALAQAGATETSLDDHFDAQLSTADQLKWLKSMSSEPNHVGSPHDKANAEWMLAQFRKWGWDAKIETFHVLFPTPIEEAVEMGSFKATLTEPPIPGDSTSRFTQPELPGYLAYQGDGDVTAPLVYVNYGTEADYRQLALMGVSVKGKIVIARYGQVWRGVKPLLAAQHGAIGCLIYSDPADDGYAVGAPYPKGPSRPPRGIQRGSVMDMMLYPGDPLTPGIGATTDAKRLTRETAGSLVKIPALPISYADAQVLLSELTGPVAPKNWRGALPITYRAGPGSGPVHLKVKSDWSLKPVYDVIAKIKGSTWPDQWVVRGNHHDGWVAGASDPLSGMVPMMDEARALGSLLKTGWRPKRTIVYTSWDGEEPMLLGSTEWAEQHAAELRKNAVIYLNTDGISRGFLHVGGSQDLGRFVTGLADGIADPETDVSVGKRARYRVLTQALEPGASAGEKMTAKMLGGVDGTLPVAPIGSGSDFSPFIDHLGVATLNVGFGGEAEGGGVYHSAYDTYEHVVRFSNPGMVYGKVVAQFVGHAVIRAADSQLPLQSPAGFATAAAHYVKQVESLASNQRDDAAEQKTLMADHAFETAANLSESHGDPVPLETVPAIDFSPLDNAVTKLDASAQKYQAALDAKGASLSAAKRAQLFAMMKDIAQTLCSDQGLHGRPWFKNLIYAPGRYIGYGVTTLPDVTEAITEQRWSDVPSSIAMAAGALTRYADRLDQATALLTAG